MYSKHRIGELFVQHRAQFRSPAKNLDKVSGYIGRARLLASAWSAAFLCPGLIEWARELDGRLVGFAYGFLGTCSRSDRIAACSPR